MNACRWTKQVEPWFDGQLPPDDAAAVSAHVEGCPACSARIEGMRRLHDAAVAIVRREEIGDAQFSAFMVGVRDGVTIPARRRHRFWAVASLTAAALIAAVSTFIIMADGPKKVDATVVESATTELQGATVSTYADEDGDTTIVVTAGKDDIW